MRGVSFWTGRLRVRLLAAGEWSGLEKLRRLPVWSLRRVGEDLEFILRPRDLARLRGLREAGRPRMMVLERRGLPFLCRAGRRRPAFVIGGVMAATLLHLLSGFLWYVRWDGPTPALVAAVERVARREGLRPGMPLISLSPDRIRRAVEREVADVGWVGLEVRGTVARVRVVAKLPEPTVSVSPPGPLVALRPAVVDRILTFRGTAVVQPGQSVLPGEVLIAPGGPGEIGRDAYAPPAGEVWGYVRLRAEAPVVSTGVRRVEGSGRGYRLRVFVGRHRILQIGREPGTAGWRVKRRRWRNSLLAVEIDLDEYREYRRVKVKNDLGPALRTARRLAWTEVNAELGERGRLVRYRVGVERRGGELVYTVRAVALTQIAGHAPEGRGEGTGQGEIRDQGGRA